MSLELELSTPQSKFFMSQAKYTALVCGFGSGKTFVGTVRLLSTVIQYPTMNFLYCAPTLSLVRDIFYPLMGELLSDIGMKYTINRSENIVFVEGHGQIFCRSMERPELLVGFSVGDALLDEWDLITIERGTQVLNKVSSRMRQRFPDGKKNQIYVTTTPEGFKQTYINFKKKPLKDSLLLRASTHSNAKNLPDDYIQSLMDQYPKELIEAYLDGKFVNLTSGSVYYSFRRENSKAGMDDSCDCTSVYRDGETLHCGIDFNVLDCSVTIGVKRMVKQQGALDKEELHIIDGLYHLNDTDEIAEVLRNKYPRSPIYVYPDSSGSSTSSKSANKSDFTILKKAGLHIRAKSKNPLIKERVASVNGALQHHKVRINVSNCKELVESLEQQVYNQNTGQPAKLINSSIDDINDSLGYLVYYIYPISRITSQQVQLSGF